MATVWYPAFDVIRIDADGFRVAVDSKSITPFNVTTGGGLPDISSDAYGQVPAGTFTATAGDVVEMQADSEPLTARYVLTATEAEAYTHPLNTSPTYIVENLGTTVESLRGIIYLSDLDHPEIPPVAIGSGGPGETVQIPYQTSVAKNVRLHLVSETGELETSGLDFSTIESTDVTISAIGTQFLALFDHYTDATTTGTAQQMLYIDQIDAGRLVVNGDKIIAEYSGVYAANANEKVIILNFAGTDVIDASVSAVSASTAQWNLELTMIRVSNTVVRVSTALITEDGSTPFIEYIELTGLDLTVNDYDLTLYGLTVTAAGDVTAKMGHGIFIPAASTAGSSDWLADLGEILTDGGDELYTAT